MNKFYSLAAAVLVSLGATAQTVDVTFNMDMSVYVAAGNTVDPDKLVRVTGNWTNPTWSPDNDAYKLTQVSGTNTYTGTFSVDVSTVPDGMEFKFLVNNAWGDCHVAQECLSGSCTNGSNDNRFIAAAQLSGNLSYSAVWDSCSNTVIAGLTPVSGIAGFNVFPNPSNDVTNVQFSVTSPSVVTFEVYNALGQRVKFDNFGSVLPGSYRHTINMSSFEGGIYFVKMNMDGKTRTTRVNLVK